MDLGLMDSEIRKITSEQNKISSTLFKISSEQKFFISELFFPCFLERFSLVYAKNRIIKYAG